jgi:hypothetical protein
MPNPSAYQSTYSDGAGLQYPSRAGCRDSVVASAASRRRRHEARFDDEADAVDYKLEKGDSTYADLFDASAPPGE